MGKKDKIQKQRIVVWETTDRRGNEMAFASIDLRAPDLWSPDAVLQASEDKK